MKYFFGFTKTESISVFIILLVLGFAVYSNLAVAMQRSRDSQRKSDIRSVHDALIKYQSDFGEFPSSENGKIVACSDGKKDEKGYPVLMSCEWGWDSLQDVGDLNYPPYLSKIPSDPRHGQGKRYYYISNKKRFQIYASLENSDEAEYDETIVSRNLPCGDSVCNVGLGFSNTPLDKSIETFEEQLREKEKKQ